MENQYNEIKDYLRKQHDANINEVRGRYHDRGYAYHYDDLMMVENISDDRKIKKPFDFIFFFKISVFVVAVFVFSCYIYGEQDLKKGFGMALSDMNEQIIQLEQDNETVKETMSYARKVWHNAKDFAKEYIDDDFIK